MTDEAWQSLYKTAADDKLRLIGGHVVSRQDAVDVLALYDHPGSTREVRRHLRGLPFDELRRLARGWLLETGAQAHVDPEGLA